MTKYTLVPPEGIYINGTQPSDIVGLHTLLQREGCVKSENLFTDEQKVVALDNIQKRIAQINQTNRKHSMDILLCVAPKKMILADAKFNAKSINNIKKADIDDKMRESRDMLSFDNYTLDYNKCYILFNNIILQPSQKNKLTRLFGERPKYQFKTAVEFYNLFEH